MGLFKKMLLAGGNPCKTWEEKELQHEAFIALFL